MPSIIHIPTRKELDELKKHTGKFCSICKFDGRLMLKSTHTEIGEKLEIVCTNHSSCGFKKDITDYDVW